MRGREGRFFAWCYGVVILCGLLSLPVLAHPPVTFNGVLIPEAFSEALREGMSIPLQLHLTESPDRESDQRIGTATLQLQGKQLRLRTIEQALQMHNASLQPALESKLAALQDVFFDDALRVDLSDDAWLILDIRQLVLQLVVKPTALGTVLRSRMQDIGQSSVDTLSGVLRYNGGAYGSRYQGNALQTSSYLSLSSTTALREHHLSIDGAFYGLGTSGQQNSLYKAMYERDYAGYRFAAGMLDSWNLQSLGPLTALPAGKIWGLSWGNQASSTVFDNAQSVTPLVAFLPAAGEVQLFRDGKLLSVQNFAMGNHEVDTRSLPYGVYDVVVEVNVSGKRISQRTERINKLFSANTNYDAPFAWQLWGGAMEMKNARHASQQQDATYSELLGISAAGSLWPVSWAGTLYRWDTHLTAETRFSLPVGERLSLYTQGMAADNRAWGVTSSVTANLPGDFSSLWFSHNRFQPSEQVNMSASDTMAMGGTLNLTPLWSALGTLSISYNLDRYHASNYYTASYQQNLYAGAFGALNLRAGLQRYNTTGSSADTGKYVALDFSLPLGNWLSAGVSHQQDSTLLNLAARKTLTAGPITAIGADISRPLSGHQQPFSGGAWAQFSTRYANGALNVSGGKNSQSATLSASGSLGWQGAEWAASGHNEGNAGVMIRTDLPAKGELSADINGRRIPLSGRANFIPLPAYARYQVDIRNSAQSRQSFDIVQGHKADFTLYPGNVALVAPILKERVTVFGRLRAEDGSLMALVDINNHIGQARTDARGEFIMDIDKRHPTLDYTAANQPRCEARLDLREAQGAVWLGDIICRGMRTWQHQPQQGVSDES